MSPASHMASRLWKLYGIVWNRMRLLNERKMHPSLDHLRTRPPCIVEQLESRLLLSAVSWDGGGDGTSWHDRYNWSGDALPGAADDVVINVAANPTIQFTSSAGSVSINSLSSDELMTISGGTLTIATSANISKSLTLGNGTLKGATITATGGAQLVAGGGTLDGVTLSADLTVGDGQLLHVKNGLTLNGIITFTGPTNSNRSLSFDGTQTLSGTGQVVLSGVGDGRDSISLTEVNSTPMTLTVAPGIVIHGQGRIENGWFAANTLINQGTISADVAGKTLTVSPSVVTNQGTMQATAGVLALSNTWTNNGTLGVSGTGVLSLGGSFTIDTLGTFSRAGGTVNLVGTLDNTGHTLALATTGTWNVSSGGTIKNGAITGTGNNQLVAGGGTLDGVTLSADLTVGDGQLLHVKNGLTLNGIITFTGPTNSNRSLSFDGTQTLSGTGQVVLSGVGDGRDSISLTEVNSTPMTLTVAPGIVIHGQGRIENGWFAANTLINQGTISADVAGKTLTVSPSVVTNQGTMQALGGATLDWNGSATFDGANLLSSQLGGTISMGGNLLGNTVDGVHFSPSGATRLDGHGTAASPQLLETMSQDLGSVNAGFFHNFAYGTLALANNTYLKLVDQSINAPGSGNEAAYVNSLVVPAGTTLDLNGLRLYARAAQIAGTLVGGTVTQIPDSGSISLATPTAGTISTASELDEWSFFDRGGHSVEIVVSTGSGGSPAPISPYLGYAEVRLLDAAGNVLAMASNTSSGQTVALNDLPLPADGTYRVQVHAPSGHTAATGNYVLSVWDVTADVAPLVLNQQVNGKIETPFSVDRWTFSAVANQQVRFDLVNSSGSGIVFDLAGPSGWTGFSDISGDSDPITLPNSGSYTLTAHGTGGQYDGTYACKLVPTVQSDLSLGTTFNGSLAGSGQTQLFRLTVPASMPMRLTFDDSSAADHNELYVKFGSPPTRGDYDYAAKGSGADQQLLIPMATAGTWYVLVYGEHVPATSAYALLATTSGLIITRTTPDHSGNSAASSLMVTGAGFDGTTTVALVEADGTAHSANAVSVDSFSQITATFAAGLPAGTYSLRLAQPDGDLAVLPGAFQVTGGGQPNLVTHLIVPGSLGRHALATLYVEYANTGTVAMPAPLLVLASGDADNSDHPLMTLDQSLVSQGFWTSATPQGFSETIQILATGNTPGMLQPGESFSVPVYYAGLRQPWNMSDNQVEFNLGVLTADNTATVDWDSMKADRRPPTMSTETWDAIWPAFAAQAGSTWGSYVAMLDDNASYLARLGQRVVDISQLLGFEFQQADGLGPVRTLSSAVDAAVQAPGLPIVFSRAFSEPISQRYVLGRLGYGWSDNWDYLLTTATDGTVTIHGPAGSNRVFQPDSRHAGTYFAQPGDHGTLTAGVSAFNLRESDGLLYAFGADGKLDYIQDTNGNKIDAIYTGSQLTSLVHYSSGQVSPDQSLQIAYNAAGRIESITDPDGRQTVFHYDAGKLHLMSADYFDGRTIGYAYSIGQGAATEHALTQITHPGAAAGTFTHQYFTYDAQGRLSSTYLDGNAERVDLTYDSAGKVTATNAAGDSSQFYFDNRGLLVKTVDGLGNAVAMAYDNAYNLTSITDPSGLSSIYSYDAKGNLVRSTDALGSVTRFTYSGTYNQLASVTDAKGNVTSYAYESDGDLACITYADGSRESWTYDSTGQPTAWTNRRGNATSGDPNDHVIAYTYDADGHLLSKTYADGSHADFTYDTRGNLRTATDAIGTTTFTYDPVTDRLMRIDYPGGLWLEFTYNATGQRESSLDQTGHRLIYHYDDVGRLDFIENESSVREVDYDYDTAGRLDRKTLGNGVYTTYEYDHAGQLLHLVNYQPDGSVLSRFDYTYDSRGRRISMATLDGAWTYTYDDIGQLTHAVFVPASGSTIPPQDQTYVYDALGNRIRTIINGVTTEYTTNNMNQYVTVGGVAYTYDRDGNLIQQGGTTYAYNDENRLVGVTAGADSWQYTYDALGNRVATTENGVPTRYVIDPIGLGNVVGEYDAGGKLIAHYDHGFGLLSRTAGGVSAYYTFDAIGSTGELTTIAGAVVNSYRYDPFGVSLAKSGTVPTPFEFIGEYGVMYEADGIQHTRERVFHSDVGRFQSEDALRRSVVGANVYAYCENDPVNFVDSVGLDRTIVCAGHMWLVVDTYDASGRVTGHVMIDLAPQFVRGNPGADWRIAPPGSSAQWWLPHWAIKSNRQADERLVEMWRSQREANNVGWNPGYNCWFPALQFAWYGIEKRTPVPPSHAQGSGSTGVGGSGDPNEKTGPAGFGNAGFISGEGTLGYRIDFENESSATAPAQVVYITDQLDGDLDWTTFRLTEVGFGDQLFAMKGNTQHFETSVTMTYNGVDFEVQIEAGVRLDTGQVYASFYSINPNTGLPPGVLTGFLPPEDGTGRGMGYFSYVIRPQTGLETGTEIRNIALISFDRQPQIGTNQIDPHDPAQGIDPVKECLNTIDADRPSSAVVSLPPVTDEREFEVNWSGQDIAGGAGIGGYTVLVSYDDGPYAPWLAYTTSTSAIFTGQRGHSYSFYSLAKDNAGNVEEKPALPEATISIRPYPIVLDALVNRSAPGRLDTIQSLDINFSCDVGDSISRGKLVLVNTRTGTRIPLTGVGFSWIPSSNTAHWDLVPLSLPPGFYTATLMAYGIWDAFGAPLDGDADGIAGGDCETPFAVAIKGDSNVDGIVDAGDYIALKRNFGTASGATWGTGDFDGDGDVDWHDLQTMTTNFGARLGAVPVAEPVTPKPTPADPVKADITKSTEPTTTTASTTTTDTVTEPEPPIAPVSDVVSEPELPPAPVADTVLEPELPVSVLDVVAEPKLLTAPVADGPEADVLAIAASVFGNRLAAGRQLVPLAAAAPANSLPPAHVAVRVGPLPTFPSPLLRLGRACPMVADVLQMAPPWWSGDSARHELPDEPWMTSLATNIAGKPRKGRLDPIGLDVLAVSR